MKNIPCLFLASLMALSTASCKKKQDNCNERDLRSLSFGFESAIEEWIDLGGTIEAKYASDVQISPDTANSGAGSVRLTVSPASYINGGNRTELAFDQMIEAGDETFYEYNLLIPANYQDVNSMRADDGKPNWQIMGQWHDQPDWCLGETWDDIAGNSPPIAVYYNYLTKSDPEYLDILKDPNTSSIYGVDTTWDRVSTLALEYAGTIIAIHKIDKGEWLNLKFQIKWARDNSGFVQAWINDQAFTDGKVAGNNMLNNASHYFKFGLYRNPAIPFTNTVFYDDIKIW